MKTKIYIALILSLMITACGISGGESDSPSIPAVTIQDAGTRQTFEDPVWQQICYVDYTTVTPLNRNYPLGLAEHLVLRGFTEMVRLPGEFNTELNLPYCDHAPDSLVDFRSAFGWRPADNSFGRLMGLAIGGKVSILTDPNRLPNSSQHSLIFDDVDSTLPDQFFSGMDCQLQLSYSDFEIVPPVNLQNGSPYEAIGNVRFVSNVNIITSNAEDCPFREIIFEDWGPYGRPPPSGDLFQ